VWAYGLEAQAANISPNITGSRVAFEISVIEVAASVIGIRIFCGNIDLLLA